MFSWAVDDFQKSKTAIEILKLFIGSGVCPSDKVVNIVFSSKVKFIDGKLLLILFRIVIVAPSMGVELLSTTFTSKYL
jgi:hypothetical protein